MALNFNKIKGLFIVDDDEDVVIKKTTEKNKETKKPDIKTKTPLTKTPKTNISSGSSSTQTNNPGKGDFNKQIFESLTKAIADANLPGEDYLEFMSALQAMKGIDLDEKIKMQTVLATLSTKGLTIQKIIESADYYMKVLENEKEKFKQAMISQTQGKVGNKHKQIKNLEDQNIKKANQIKTLTNDINKNTVQIGKIKKDLETADLKIKSTENNFNVTYAHVANQIKNKVEKIKTLINNK
ncbi:MAG: hypothetical protein B6I20_03570 [Bacteroidetes bacterium 4572_117]|nr:MAG: hypothetical protein B6I20_03570 [Bacteroidetes bacterium 4572_117]